MPQGDLYTFPSTVVGLGLSFVGGYFVFVGWWAPRWVLLTKSRAWLTRFGTSPLVGQPSRPVRRVTPVFHAAALAAAVDPTGWPEWVLAAVQFGLLVWLLTRLTLDATTWVGLENSTRPTTPVGDLRALTYPVVNVVELWARHRTRVGAHAMTHLAGWPTRVFAELTPHRGSTLLSRVKLVATQVQA